MDAASRTRTRKARAVLSIVAIDLGVGQDGGMPATARARVRAEITTKIVETARRHLAEQGPAALSLRAVARDVGMVSSAVYRYFPSRDQLLTRLIVDAYGAVADGAESADALRRRGDHVGRWLAVSRAIRSWAADHIQEYG